MDTQQHTQQCQGDLDSTSSVCWARFVPSTSRFPTGILKMSPFTVGRRSDNDLCVSHPAISGLHATITRDDSSQLVFITDHSTNGTFIGTDKIGKGNRRVLSHGDRVILLSSETDKIIYTFYLEESRSQHIKDYIIEKSLGSGAFAEVFRVVHQKTGQRFALKRIDRKKLNMSNMQNQSSLFHPTTASNRILSSDLHVWFLLLNRATRYR